MGITRATCPLVFQVKAAPKYAASPFGRTCALFRVFSFKCETIWLVPSGLAHKLENETHLLMKVKTGSHRCWFEVNGAG